ncbi:MAG: HAD-IIIA family hydrolase [bacterium]|nr:HAD-IIIA family hydrolase [bacterium]
MSDTEKTKAIFIDRDGVINEPVYRGDRLQVPLTLEEFILLPGAIDGVGLLKDMGYLCLVMTNQPDVAFGDLSLQSLKTMHDFIRLKMPVDDVVFCPHSTKSDECNCCKPKTGMIDDLVEKYNIDLAKSFIIGDRWREAELGKNVGCRTIHIPSSATPYNSPPFKMDFAVGNLIEAAKLIKEVGS